MIIFEIDDKAIMVEMYFNLQMKMTLKICPKFSAKFRSRWNRFSTETSSFPENLVSLPQNSAASHSCQRQRTVEQQFFSTALVSVSYYARIIIMCTE